MPQISVNDVDVYYRDEGQGEPIIFGHSSTGSSGQWRSTIERLAGRYRCLAPDHLGYGRTGAFTGERSLIDDETAVIRALLDLAGRPAHLVGHSFGGAVLIRAALRMPDRVKTLTVIEPILFYLLKLHDKNAEFAEINCVADRVARYIHAGDSGAVLGHRQRGAAAAAADIQHRFSRLRGRSRDGSMGQLGQQLVHALL